MELLTATTGQKNAEFNRFLLKIADEITKDELDGMKFLCEDDLPKGRLDSIENPRELLNFLKVRGKIGLDDVSYLVSLLEDIGNIQLANTVMELGEMFFFNSAVGRCQLNPLMMIDLYQAEVSGRHV